MLSRFYSNEGNEGKRGFRHGTPLNLRGGSGVPPPSLKSEGIGGNNLLYYFQQLSQKNGVIFLGTKRHGGK